MADFTDPMKHKTDYLSEREVQSMLNYCWKNDRLRDFMLILTLVRTGRRVTEIVGEEPYTRKVGLRPIDIRYDDGLIEFDILKKNPIRQRGRNGKIRDKRLLNHLRIKKLPKRKLIPVDDDYMNKLRNYVQMEGISLRRRIFDIHRTRANQIIWDVSSECGISRPNKKIHPHSFRHTYSINFLKKNANNSSALIYLQELIDHTDLKTTKVYAQFTQDDIKKLVNKASKSS